MIVEIDVGSVNAGLYYITCRVYLLNASRTFTILWFYYFELLKQDSDQDCFSNLIKLFPMT